MLTGQASYRITQETAEGFKFRAELTVHEAISGQDQTELEAGWAEVGGEGGVPCLDADVPNDMFTLPAIHTQTSAYAFGTLTIHNVTPGDFDAPATMWQFTAGGVNTHATAMGVGFSDGTKCDGMSSGGFMLNPNMTDAEWGPVPVVFAYDGVFTPKTPNGNPAIVEDSPIQVSRLTGADMFDGDGNPIEAIAIRVAR